LARSKAAVRIMRKLYESTGGQPQRSESLGHLGAVTADAAGIDRTSKSFLIAVTTQADAPGQVSELSPSESLGRFASCRSLNTL